MKNIIAVALFCMLIVSEVSARKVEDWPYERLFKESDLVIIAHVQGWGVNKKEWNEKFFDKGRFEGVKTIFGAAFTLKGDPPLCIWLNHFRYKEGVARYNDGPGLVAFLKKPILIELKQAEDKKGKLQQLSKGLKKISQPEYLLFLKKHKDGVYEPVSGQLDASFSVRAMDPPNSIKVR
ncbi:hypothetical protein OAK45_07410 [Verrucomicrobia bacterium]|nr:hypothetical protein [Verrucomicrobiota bacterium]MDC0219111.1 hypothetical protein [Verrucomicrobiota bacterium]